MRAILLFLATLISMSTAMDLNLDDRIDGEHDLYSCLSMACYTGRWEIIAQMYEKFPDTQMIHEALQLSLQSGQSHPLFLEKMCDILGDDVALEGQVLEKILLQGLAFGREEAVRYIAERYGYDLKRLGENGLMAVCYSSSPALLRTFLSLTAPSPDTEAAEPEATKINPARYISVLARKKDAEMLGVFMEDPRFNSKECFAEALKVSAEYGCLAVLEFLLKDGRGWVDGEMVGRAFVGAFSAGAEPTSIRLLQEPLVDVNIRNRKGESALLCAAQSDLPLLVHRLLSHPSLHLAGDEAQTTINTAYSKNHQKVLDLLLLDERIGQQIALKYPQRLSPRLPQTLKMLACDRRVTDESLAQFTGSDHDLREICRLRRGLRRPSNNNGNGGSRSRVLSTNTAVPPVTSRGSSLFRIRSLVGLGKYRSLRDPQTLTTTPKQHQLQRQVNYCLQYACTFMDFQKMRQIYHLLDRHADAGDDEVVDGGREAVVAYSVLERGWMDEKSEQLLAGTRLARMFRAIQEGEKAAVMAWTIDDIPWPRPFHLSLLSQYAAIHDNIPSLLHLTRIFASSYSYIPHALLRFTDALIPRCRSALSLLSLAHTTHLIPPITAQTDFHALSARCGELEAEAGEAECFEVRMFGQRVQRFAAVAGSYKELYGRPDMIDAVIHILNILLGFPSST